LILGQGEDFFECPRFRMPRERGRVGRFRHARSPPMRARLPPVWRAERRTIEDMTDDPDED
jgi:hypothetical protein